MAKRKNYESQNGSRRENYLTTKILIAAAKAGIKTATASTIAVMSYNVIAQNGWVVKKWQNGTVEKIIKLTSSNSGAVILDK